MRYLRLYAHFLRFSFSKALQFRLDFTFRIVMDLVYYLVQFVFFNVIYLYTDILAGWNQEQMHVFIGAYIFVDALHMTVFANNCWWFPKYINRGDLDYYITKPVSPFFFLSVREFAANSFFNLLFAVGILVWSLASYSASFEIGKLLLFGVFLINGTLLYFALHILFLLSVFWTQSDRGFDELFYAFDKTYQRPDGIYKRYLKGLLLYVLPFSVVASYPTRVLFENNTGALSFTIALSSLTTYILVALIWKRGLRIYSSASS